MEISSSRLAKDFAVIWSFFKEWHGLARLTVEDGEKVAKVDKKPLQMDMTYDYIYIYIHTYIWCSLFEPFVLW